MDGMTNGVMSDKALTFSIVICTDGRAEALRNTLRSLEDLEYARFEVCVVHGPTEDGTRELLAEYDGRIKVASNPVRNLSVSRNIGIALAAGEIVAFLDDDAIPEPEWLRDLANAYSEQRVGAAGGFVYNHIGTDFQYRYSVANRLGRQKVDGERVTSDMNFPLTATFAHLQGTNCSFRRNELIAIGGFDEEYEYYLDESDVMVRLVDAGHELEIIDGAYVHHKFLPSSMRDVEWGNRVLHSWYPVIKNKIYFALRHGQRHFSFNSIIDDSRHFIDELARDVDWAASRGLLSSWDQKRFWEEVDKAWADGLTRGLANQPRLLIDDTLRQWASPFLPFSPAVPASGRRTYCFVSQEYTIGKMGGIGRYTRELAAATAAMGHHVHVITLGQEYDRVDYENGVWVHRIVDRPAHGPQLGGLKMPWYRWGRAVTVLEIVDAINAKRRVDAVSAPIWDCEGIALAGRYPLTTVLLTSMIPWMASNPLLAGDRKFVREHARPMIEAETYLLRHSDRIIASTQAILEETAQLYGLRIDPAQVARIPYGLSDWTALPRKEPAALPEGALRIVFIGRLEERKGVDVLLSAAKGLLGRHPEARLDLVGDDTIPGPKGRTWRQVFEADPQATAVLPRVHFHGAVSDERLRGFYAAADIFVAPSRFESFGLILVEGMMFGKPVVGCRAGGMVEVVEEGVSGLLAEPGDAASLDACLERLLGDAELRSQLGAAARARYEEHFTVQRMASAHVAAMQAISEAGAVELDTPGRDAGALVGRV